MKRKKEIKTLEQASEKLSAFTKDIVVVEYGGKVTVPSKFFNHVTGLYFFTDLRSVVRRLKTGYEHGLRRIWDCGQALYKKDKLEL